MTKTFPTLFKKTSTGASQMWEISVENNVIITRFGQVDGKIQETRDLIKSGKNLGKANETSANQQAELEAQSAWEKKKKAKGYVESLKDAKAGKVDALVEGGIFPMLAHRFDEQGHKIEYPAFVQPKFDGHRCISMYQDGKATLWSRTRKPILSMPHIVAEVERLAKKEKLKSLILDGELYSHKYKDQFEKITSLIRPDEPREGHELVEYHVYDMVNEESAQFERLPILECIRVMDSKALIPVKTVTVNDEDELMLAFDAFLAEGYEGAMVRNTFGKYVNKRSYDLQKVKEFKDEEFRIVGVEEGRGKLAGHGIFVCSTNEGVEFKAKMKGTTESLKDYFENPKKYIGKLLTVKFQGWTQKNGVPRFPVAERIRQDL
jgi:ATP-dependent DNA ligase